MPDNTTLRAEWQTPAAHRFGADHPGFESCMAAHDAATDAGQAGYLDPATGLFVMTATYLSQRPCCDNACRHCPWVADQ